jgi:hypothetical protein
MPFVTVRGKRFWIQPSEIKKDSFNKQKFITKNGKKIFIDPRCKGQNCSHRVELRRKQKAEEDFNRRFV